ncbi:MULTISPECIES: PhnA domain-containing protein [Mesorhizobium]|uniref:PhnA domain-containing protein n=1 Tax=Mesorhizobium TaxID=68287 RepID=UPI001FE460C9|nr:MULTISPECIES: PhnA domain-containing protein [Mesorhizobium]
MATSLEMADINASAGSIEVRDAAGTMLADGDSVVLVKNLEVKGAGQTVKKGTVIHAKSCAVIADRHYASLRCQSMKLDGPP